MATIKYEVHNIHNALGKGNNRPYIQLRLGKALSEDELEERIEQSCTATKSDVKAVMTELRHAIIDELSCGHRVYLPEIGYLELSVGNIPPSKKKDGKISGKDIYLKGINFEPERSIVRELASKVSFEKSDYSTLSANYSEEELWTKIENYLSQNRFITCKRMVSEFGLSKYIARKWLAKFVEEGKLTKDGTPHQPIYFKR